MKKYLTTVFIIFVCMGFVEESLGRGRGGGIVEVLNHGRYIEQMKNMSFFEYKRADYISNISIGYVFKSDYISNITNFTRQINDRQLIHEFKDSLNTINIFREYNRSTSYELFKECTYRYEALAELIKDKYNANILNRNKDKLLNSKIQFMEDSLNLLCNIDLKKAKQTRNQNINVIDNDNELTSLKNMLKSKVDSITLTHNNEINRLKSEMQVKLDALGSDGYYEKSHKIKAFYNDKISQLTTKFKNKIRDTESYWNNKIEFRSKIIESKKKTLLPVSTILSNIRVEWDNEIAKQSAIIRKNSGVVSYEGMINAAEEKYKERLKLVK